MGLEQQPLTEGTTEWQQIGQLISVLQMPLPTRGCGLIRSQTGRQSHHRLQATLRHVSRLGFAQGFCSMCVNNRLLMRSECRCECFVFFVFLLLYFLWVLWNVGGVLKVCCRVTPF